MTVNHIYPDNVKPVIIEQCHFDYNDSILFYYFEDTVFYKECKNTVAIFKVKWR